MKWTLAKPKASQSKPTVTNPASVNPKVLPAEVVFGQKLLEEISAKAKNAPQFTNYVLEVEPILKGTMWEKTQTEGITQSFAMLHALDLLPNYKIYIFVSWTDEWLRERLTTIGSECATYSFSGGAYCSRVPVVFAHPGWFAKNWRLPVDARQAPSQNEIGLVGNMPHEIAHAGQVFGHTKYGASSWRLQPAWLREGWAELFKVLYWAESRKISFAEAHKLFINTYSIDCAKHSILDLSSSGSHREQGFCEYTNGYYATLKLLETVKDVDLQFRMPGARASTQAEAFQQTFGLDYAQFAQIADAFFKESLYNRSWW